MPIWANGLNQGVLISQFLVLQNFTETYGSFAPSWSITNEVVYYGLFGGLTALVVPLKIRACVIGNSFVRDLGNLHAVRLLGGLSFDCNLEHRLAIGLGFNWFLGAQLSSVSDELCSLDWLDSFRMDGLPLLR